MLCTTEIISERVWEKIIALLHFFILEKEIYLWKWDSTSGRNRIQSLPWVLLAHLSVLNSPCFFQHLLLWVVKYLTDVQLQTPNLDGGFKKFKSRFFLSSITVFSKELWYLTDFVWDAFWKLLFIKILKFSGLGYNYMPKNNVNSFHFPSFSSYVDFCSVKRMRWEQ